MSRPHLAAALAVVAFPAPPALAQMCYPMVTRVEPSAIRRGTTAELTLSSSGGNGGGDNFAGTFALLCEPPGLSGLALEAGTVAPVPKAKAKAKGRGRRRVTGFAKVRLSAGTDTPLGPRELRVATPQGVSSVGLVVVVDDPVVTEADDKANDEPAGAQPLTFPCAVSGAVGKLEDVDRYAFDARAGQVVTFSVWANRLENKVHDLAVHFDPILFLYDDSGRELAADDNHDFADPRLSFKVPNDGTYQLLIRDTTYGGNANWTYVLQATAGPVASAVVPLAVNPGSKATLHASGPNIDPAEAIAFDAPRTLPPGPQLVAIRTSKGPTLATPLVVTSLPVVPEEGDTPAEPAKAQAVKLPAAVCGKLGAAGDVDVFRFEAKKGDGFVFEVASRRAGAATDPVLTIRSTRNGKLAEADDSPGLGKDCRLEWSAPDSGAFEITVADLHARGGDEFGYVVLAAPSSPDFVLTCDPDKVNVGPGGRVPLFVQVARRSGFTGPVKVGLGPLPPGVSATPLTVRPGMTQGVVVVSASTGAKPAAMLMAVGGKAEVASGPIARPAAPNQEIYVPGGGRALYPVDTLALAVTEAPDITVEASPASVRLTPGGTATLDVTVTRKPGFDKGVNLDVILQHLGGVHANPLPPGVTLREAGSKTLLGPSETRGKIVLQAAAGAAPCEGVPVCVLGNVSVNFVVKTSYASGPVAVSVVK